MATQRTGVLEPLQQALQVRTMKGTKAIVSIFLVAAAAGCAAPDDGPAEVAGGGLAATCTKPFEATDTVSPEALTTRLATAVAGEVIRVTPGTLQGSIVVPAGVVLLGDGVEVVAEGGAGLRLTGGSATQPTVIRGFTVRTIEGAPPVAAVVAVGGDALVLSDLKLALSTGAGIISEGVRDLQICGTEIAGGLDEANFAALSDLPTVAATDAAILGLVVTAGERLTKAGVDIRDLVIRNIAGFGAAFVDTEAAWAQGRVEGCAGTGIFLSRSTHGWTDVVVTGGRASSTGSATFQTGWGVVNTEASRLDTDGLQVVGIPGFGVFQSGSRSQHLGARIVANTMRGVLVQESLSNSIDDPELLFDQAVIAGNGGAGIQVIDGGGVVFQNGIIAESRSLPTLNGGFGDLVGTISDGIQLNSVSATSVGTQLRADRAVIYGNGKAGINAAGTGTQLLSEGSAGLSVCGTTELDTARWTCNLTAEEGWDCLRERGPSVSEGWQCSDTGGATVCSSSDPAQAVAQTPGFAVVSPSDGLPSFCRSAAESIVGENGLVVSTGVAAAGSATGFQKATPGAVGVGYDWRCRSEAGVRICTMQELDRLAVDDADNPSLTQGSGWSCSYTETGRRCLWGGFGIVTGGDVVGSAGFLANVEPRIIDRDQLVRSGLIAPPGMELRRDPTTVPALRGGARSIVGENGLVNPDGSLGSRAIVGENGVVGEDG